ncbi:hypothetical protein CROQUDRAFT_654181 [Cronartium quercuum f. sp. fusiforme G11]|uniref:BTB domain-containing protein n=1 Tax=Cronartium quercuum f. sp. fusiforme G11 TaxID=708437 RepID=A0A9P6NRV0_9BASI|nr:hypothetical protein CROQUDRAFT_654181 [Cronartium quercuum f. sp. fusiforme G11]
MRPKKHSKSCCPARELARHVTSTLINSNQVDIELQSFGHIYRLHRVILSQVDLFRNFLNDSGPGPISITFPGHIHRAAFEICLTRIYGGGPELVPPPWASVDSEPFLLGRTHALLSHAVDLDTLISVEDQDIADEKADWESLLKTEDSQPAPPTLLISILSCANYLGLQTLADEVAELINHTITPFTVVTYLNFAHGDCLDNETLSECLQTGCRTLEGVARPAPENPDHHHEIMQESQSNERHAEKIGQVCASWLSKWASELLALEEVLIIQDENILLPALPEEIELIKRWPALRRPPMCVWRYKGGLNSAWVRVLISSDGLFLGPEICGPQDQRPGDGRGGEWERYGLARRVSKLRERERRESLDSGTFDKRLNVPSSSITPNVKPDPDALSSSYKRDPELIRMFHDGIYYSHLTFQQLAFVADDRCPIWKTEYVSPPRLQRANCV